MDRGKRLSMFVGNRNHKIYMDLKDIIRENALPFLPAKSLLRFTGVCRDWKLQIATPFFAHNQSNSFRDILGFFCQSEGNPPSFISLDPKSCGVPDPSLQFLPEPVDIRASSNGLLCCQGRSGYKAYYICNPVTKQWKKLPKPNANHGSDPALVLVFEPSLLSFLPDYKLVCAFPSADFDNGYEFEIYSSAEGSWRISGEIYFGNRKLLPRSGVHANGIVYWQTPHNSGIVAFDLKMERSQVIYAYQHGSMGVMNGKLCMTWACGLVLIVNFLSNAYTNTMQMNSKAKTWELKQKITLDSSVFSGVTRDQTTVPFASGDLVVIQFGKSLYSYDMKRKQIASLGSATDYDMRLVSYVNSLVEV